MDAKIEVGGRAVQALVVPENAEVAFMPCLGEGVAPLDLVRVNEPVDPVYGRVSEAGEVQLLAEARPIVEAIELVV